MKPLRSFGYNGLMKLSGFALITKSNNFYFHLDSRKFLASSKKLVSQPNTEVTLKKKGKKSKWEMFKEPLKNETWFKIRHVKSGLFLKVTSDSKAVIGKYIMQSKD